MPNENVQEIKITDNLQGAEYTNLANISHNKEEFQLMFANVLPPVGRVVAKIITTPGHFKRMIAAMNENLKRYESSCTTVCKSAPRVCLCCRPPPKPKMSPKPPNISPKSSMLILNPCPPCEKSKPPKPLAPAP